MQNVSLLKGSLVSAVIFVAYTQPPVNQTGIVTWRFQSGKNVRCWLLLNKPCLFVYNGIIGNAISVHRSKKEPVRYKEKHLQVARFW